MFSHVFLSSQQILRVANRLPAGGHSFGALRVRRKLVGAMSLIFLESVQDSNLENDLQSSGGRRRCLYRLVTLNDHHHHQHQQDSRYIMVIRGALGFETHSRHLIFV